MEIIKKLKHKLFYEQGMWWLGLYLRIYSSGFEEQGNPFMLLKDHQIASDNHDQIIEQIIGESLEGLQ